MTKKFLNIKEVSSILAVSKLTLRNWDKSGKLIARRHPINNYRVYDKKEIEDLLKKIESGQKTIKYSKTKSKSKNKKSKRKRVIPPKTNEKKNTDFLSRLAKKIFDY